ncbi:MAG: hypothetical protein MUE40_01345 [Anaerolineae bacterium]|jgi:hypothetical protein|nr:hypothetical protein [Anaerolineae bacterium]
MSIKEETRRQVFTTLVTNALLRWESLATILVTAILFLFVRDVNIAGIDWQPWFWLVLGGIAEAALVISTVTDPEEAQEVMSREFESRYDLGNIRNRVSRERLKTALEYRRNMLKLVRRHQGAMRLQLRDTLDAINQWIAQMYELAQHIDSFESNEIVERDIKEVPQKIEKVQIRLAREQDDRVKSDLQNQLKLLEQQKRNLEDTRNSVKRAEIQLESALSSLGTMYAQISLLGTKGEVDGTQMQRRRLEIQDEIASLQDTIEAMDEVQRQSLRLR